MTITLAELRARLHEQALEIMLKTGQPIPEGFVDRVIEGVRNKSVNSTELPD